ncbi:MAG: DUF2855 family protein [Sedimentitalea sp.]
MSVAGQDLIVNRADLSDAVIAPSQFPDTPPEGQCLLRIDRFALTANNITYAVAPEHIGYWNFFPHDRDGFGRVPVWGYGDVIASGHADIAPGTRVYGYFPMSTHLMVSPGKITPFGFTDIAEHRAPMATIYNQYSFTKTDPGYAPDLEGLISLFRPLFTTSFLLDDLHRDNNMFGATQVILSSASSKTSMSLAHLLSQGGTVQVVGLTSASNRAFVEGLGCYSQVLSYDDIDKLDRVPSAFVDMAGSAKVLRALHSHLDGVLANSCRVGLTHWDALADTEIEVPGPKPKFFFAPSYAQQRISDWGVVDFQTKLGKAWAGFIENAQGWITVQEAHGATALLEQYHAALSGRADPAQGHVLSLTEG